MEIKKVMGASSILALVAFVMFSCGLVASPTKTVTKEVPVEVIKEVEVEKEVIKEVEVVKEVEGEVSDSVKLVLCAYSSTYPVLWETALTYFNSVGLNNTQIRDTMGHDAYDTYIATVEGSPAVEATYCQ